MDQSAPARPTALPDRERERVRAALRAVADPYWAIPGVPSRNRTLF